VKDGKFEIGDRVRVKRPKGTVVGWPGWVSDMDKYNGGSYIIIGVFEEDCNRVGAYLKNCSTYHSNKPWMFDVAWLELVGSAKEMCQDCGSEMKDVQLFTSTTKICPKCKK
jgi:hypothetical protein